MVGSWWRRHTRREVQPSIVHNFAHYIPWLYFSIKSWHPLFFSNVNPGMPSGWFVEVSKYHQLASLPVDTLPRMIHVERDESIDSVEQKMRIHDLIYPVIVKPNNGGRNGTNVLKVSSRDELLDYMNKATYDILLQELATHPLEFGVFYVRMPWEEKWYVSGIVSKEFMSVTGNGKDTLHELVATHERAKKYLPFIKTQNINRWHTVTPLNETVILNYVGNHCKWSLFYDRSDLVTPELEKTFDTISKTVPGFYCWRYDLKANSVEDLIAGRFKVLELNGVISEPTRIYDPERSVWNGYKEIFRHRKIMYRISKANHRAGIQYISLRKAYEMAKKYGV